MNLTGCFDFLQPMLSCNWSRTCSSTWKGRGTKPGNTTTHGNLISREFDITGIQNAREFDITGIRNAREFEMHGNLISREFESTGI